MSQATIDQGLLLVYGEPGENVTEAEFNDWYDNEHAPARLTIAGISSAARYKAVDGETPSYIAIYDAADPAVLSSKEYMDLMANASRREKELIPKLKLLKRGIWQLRENFEQPGQEQASKGWRGTKLLVTTVQPKEGEDAGLDEWYQDVYFPLLSTVPGFLRARRYKLVSHLQIAGKEEGTAPAEYLEVVEWEDGVDLVDVTNRILQNSEGARGISQMDRRETRRFGIHRKF